MKFFKKINSLQKKLSIITYAIVLVPVLILFLYINYNARIKAINEYENDSGQRLNTIVTTMDRKLYLLLDRSSYIKQHSDIIRLLSETEWGGMEKAAEGYQRLDKILVSYTLPFDEAQTEIFIYPVNSEIPNTKYIGDLDSLKKKKIWTEIEKLETSIYPCVWESSETEDGKYIYLYRNIKNYTNNTIGILELKMDYRNIRNILQSIKLLNEENIDYITKNGISVLGNSSISEKEYFFSEAKLINGDIIRIRIPRKAMDNPMNTITIIFAFLSVIIAVHFVDRLIVQSLLKEMGEFVKQIKSDSAYLKNEQLIKVDGNDEISVIKQSFKDIIKSTRLVHEELDKADKKQRQLEFELLQTGINPHLLYNLMSIFRWKMLRQHQTEMVKIIDSMTKYYRLALSGGKCFIKLSTELDLIKYYVEISEYCHENRYKLVFDVDETIMEYEVIKLILQPFVENAVIHGLNSMKNGVITITGKTDGENIYLSVSDNGYGMEAEVAESLRTGSYTSDYGGYGIKNTNNRIKSFYGEKSGIEMSSKKGEGTRVVIKIPHK